MGSQFNARDELLAKIKRSSIIIPDMQPAFDQWPASFVNRHWKKAVPWMNTELETHVHPKFSQQKF